MILISQKSLENVLIRSWTDILDRHEITKIIHQGIKNKKDWIENPPTKTKGTRLTVSQFRQINQGWLLWIEFHSTLDGYVFTGTMELTIQHDSYHYEIIGCRSLAI